MNPYVDLDPAQAAILTIRKADKPLIDELCKDPEFNKAYESLKKMLQRKIDNENFFVAIDVAEGLKKCHRMLAEYAIAEEQGKVVRAEEILKDIAKYERDMQARYALDAKGVVDVIPDEDPEFNKELLKDLLKDLGSTVSELQAAMQQHNILLQEMETWHEKTWKPLVKQQAEATAKRAKEIFKDNKEIKEITTKMNTLVDTLELKGGKNKAAFQDEVKILREEQEEVLRKQLKHHPEAHDFLRIPQLRQEALENQRQREIKGESPAEAKRNAIQEVAAPVQKLHLDISFMGYASFLRNFRELCLKNLDFSKNPELLAELKGWEINRMVRTGLESDVFRKLIDENQAALSELHGNHSKRMSSIEESTNQQAKLVGQLENLLGQVRAIENKNKLAHEIKPSEQETPRPSPSKR